MNLNERIRQLLDDSTGKWAFYLPMFYFAAPLSILASALQDFDSQKPKTFLFWLLASAIGFLCMVAAVILSSAVFNKVKHFPKIVLPTYVLFAFLIGAIKGLATGYFGGLLVGQTTFNNALPPRLITSGLISLFIIPAGSIFLSSRERFNAMRDQLIQESIQIESQMEANNVSAAQMQNSASLNSESEIAKEMSALLRSLVTIESMSASSQWELISSQLKRLVDENIRPISQSLWRERQEKYPQLTYRELLRLALTRFSFPMTFVVGANLLGTTGQFLRHSPEASLPLTLLWTTSGIVIPYIGIKKAVNRLLISGEAGFILLVISSTSLESIRLRLDGADVNNLTLNFNSTIFAIFLSATLITSGAISVALNSQSQTIKELSSLVDNDRIKLIASEISKESMNRDLARYLHGHLQTRLMSMALALDIASKTKDHDKASEAINEIKLVLENPMYRDLKPKYSSVEEALTRISDNWRGIVKIDLRIVLKPVQIDPSVIQNLATLVEEAITNSVRHGHASKLSILISNWDLNFIELEVKDDGSGIKSNEKGLGSDFFTSICGANWTVSDREDSQGAKLSALLKSH